MKHLNCKTIAAALLLAATAIVMACDKDGNTSQATVQNITNNGCHSHTDLLALAEKDPYSDTDSLSYAYNHGTLHLTHHNLLVNCAFEEGGIDVDITVEGNTISIREYEHSGPLADCICRTDNSFQITHLPHGTYTLVFLSWYPEPRSFTITV